MNNNCRSINANIAFPWTEHTLNPFAFSRALRETGFNSKILLGDYGVGQGSSVRRGAAHILNFLVKTLHMAAFPVAPYYVVIGSRVP